MDKRIIDEFNANAPFSLEDGALLVLAKVGSHAHNTYVPSTDPNSIDDVDYMGVVMPPMSYVLGLDSWESLVIKYEELDCVFYSFHHFIRMLKKNNPNVLGMLYMKEYEQTSDEWSGIILPNRNAFRSKNVYFSFLGYARDHFKKMTAFTPAVLDRYESLKELVQTPTASREQIKEYNELKKKYFSGYMGEKRRNLVKKYGYDVKDASHLIRLMRMCCEYIKTGALQVYRTHDAEELKTIKTGGWSFDRVTEEVRCLFEEAECLFGDYVLPESVDNEYINYMVVDVVLSCYGLDKIEEVL